VAWLLQCVQDCIVSPLLRLPAIITSFISHAVRPFSFLWKLYINISNFQELISFWQSLVVSRADHHLFVSINEWFTSRALVIELESVPMFSQLFTSPPTHQGRDREWLLRVILSGLRSAEDLAILQRRQVLSVLCLHSTSRLSSSDRERDVIWRIIDRSLLADASSHRLTLDHGLISWIGQLLTSPECNPIILRHACIALNSILSFEDVSQLSQSLPLSTQVELFCFSAMNALGTRKAHFPTKRG